MAPSGCRTTASPPGGGGLSGRPLLPLLIEWIEKIRALGLRTPIIGGGGILCPEDAKKVIAAGATAISIGCASMLRPWRVADIIRTVNAMHQNHM